MGSKKLAETGKNAAGQIESESHIDFFFTSRVFCIMNPHNNKRTQKNMDAAKRRQRKGI
jgi:hypothetical protein